MQERIAYRGPTFDDVRSRVLPCLALALIVAAVSDAAHADAPPPADPAVDFALQVRPIFARRCFQCHGPDEAEGGLRLHERDTALGQLDSGEHAVVPGEPDKSELLARVSAEDEFLRMPPEGKPLAPEEIDLLRRWIGQGAAWDVHWAFQPVRPQTPPDVDESEWVRTPIDAFILHKLQANGLRPNPPAEKGALLRRVYYDLTGLPPTPAEVEAFVADDSPDAWEKVVDRLLDSPRYGERWARHWLDVVRFAETNSFERDGRKPHAWRYRDYVIRSFNDDKPYDQFLREQLAGDELPEVTADSIIATGYYRLGLWDDEPADRLQARYDVLDDIIATTTQGMLGLTVDCARCHDHKIDPIPQTDYYSLLAFFQGITPMAAGGPNIEQPVFPDEEARRAYDAAAASLKEKRDAAQAQLTAIEDEFRRRAAQALRADVEHADLDDLEYRFYRDTWQRLPVFDDLKPETVGRLDRPFFDISLATRDDFFGFVFTGVLKVPQDGEYTFTLDSDDGSRLTIDGRTVLEYDGIHGLGNPKTATVPLRQGRLPIRLDYFQWKFGKGLVVNWSGPGFESRPLSAPDGAADLQRTPVPELIKTVGERVLGRRRLQEYRDLQKRLDELKRERPPADYALCVTEVGPQAPDTFLLQRGNPHVPGEKVEPGFPALFEQPAPQIPSPPPGAKTPGRRLVLADWIASPENRLTARVMVNRVWQHHFGRGIVRSANNFGELGDPPTHPELLDWLAAEFVRQGWRLKPLHKLILMSNAYQMSSAGSPEGLAKDPANGLFWRFDMRRLSAEEVRDSIHAVNGRLNLKMYGPGYFPDISQEVLAGQSQPGAGWGKSSPEEQARRSVYIHVKRSLITPLLETFDFPDTDTSCEARFATTQPGQALGMLNGEFLHRQAAGFADRLRREAGADRAAQAALALRLALCREPQPEEVARGLDLIETLQREHGVEGEKVLEYYCLFVLNLNEFLYLD